MTNQEPATWSRATTGAVGLDLPGQLPDCADCAYLALSPPFAEAVRSAATRQQVPTADMALRTISSYHARQHPTEMAAAAR